MSFLQFDAFAMLVLTGLWSGVILTFAVERTNLWSRMPIEQYVIDFRRSLFRVDPLQPILGGLAGIAGIVFALSLDGTAQVLAWGGVAAIAAVMVGSVVLAEPINSKFRRLPEGQAPDRAEHYREYWRKFHAVRNVIAVVAFVCVVAAEVWR